MGHAAQCPRIPPKPCMRPSDGKDCGRGAWSVTTLGFKHKEGEHSSTKAHWTQPNPSEQTQWRCGCRGQWPPLHPSIASHHSYHQPGGKRHLAKDVGAVGGDRLDTSTPQDGVQPGLIHSVEIHTQVCHGVVPARRQTMARCESPSKHQTLVSKSGAVAISHCCYHGCIGFELHGTGL